MGAFGLESENPDLTSKSEWVLLGSKPKIPIWLQNQNGRFWARNQKSRFDFKIKMGAFGLIGWEI